MPAELFIIWLKGYLAGIGGDCTAEQVAEINAKLNSIDPSLTRGPGRRTLMEGLS